VREEKELVLEVEEAQEVEVGVGEDEVCRLSPPELVVDTMMKI